MFHQKKMMKKFEKNNLTTALNVLDGKKIKIYPVYVSKHNPNCKKQVNDTKWRIMVLSFSKKLSVLLRGTPPVILYSELPSFLSNKKQT